MKLNKFAETPTIKKHKADCKAEVHFIGQIVGGENFITDEGLFC